MALGSIFSYPVKEEITTSLQGLSIAVAGMSKSGKSTLCSQASRPIFLQTESGDRNLVGITPVPISTFGDFKSAVNQLCTSTGREKFDTVVIDSITNLLLIADKAYAAKASEAEGKDSSGNPIVLEMASHATFGKGLKFIKEGIASQLQKLTNAGFLLMNIIHVEEKTDFKTQKTYVGPTISTSLNNLIERFVDQTIYLSGKQDGDYRINFTPKGGYSGTGGRYTMLVESVPNTFENLEKAFHDAIQSSAKNKNAKLVDTSGETKLEVVEYDFLALKEEFKHLTAEIMKQDRENAAKIQAIVAEEIGSSRKATDLQIEHVENLHNIIQSLKEEFKVGE